MGPGRKMELPYRRYSVPETVMRKYWMSREKANSKHMVDKSAQTEWRPCVIWTEASSTGSRGRSASEPWLQCTEVASRGNNCRPASAPSTPSWSSTTLPPPTTSAPTSSTSTSLPTTDPTRSPRPPASVQVLCFHHGVSKADVIIQFPEPSDSTPSEDFPPYIEVGVNTEYTPPHSPIPEESSHDIGVQTASRPPTCSEDAISNNKLCQTDFTVPPTPPHESAAAQSKRVDFSCQTEKSIDLKGVSGALDPPFEMKGKEEYELRFKTSELSSNSDEQLKNENEGELTEATCTSGNYKDFPCTDMVIPRYSAVPRTGSMVVNMSSVDNISDSDLSLTDSLEDPCEDLISQWPENKLDNRLVRGEVSQASISNQRSYISSKNTYAYFLFLSGEEGSIKEYKVPDKLEARLRRREEEIKKVYGMKYKNIPKITYRKRRKIHPVVLRETESQTNISKPVATSCIKQPQNRKILTSKSFDSSCECNTVRKTSEENASLKRLDRSKTISTFNIASDTIEDGVNNPIPQQSTNLKRESSDERPKISLTVTVPSRSKGNDEETIDDKVARVLIQSLQEIRSQQQSFQTKVNNKQTTTELSEHFLKKAKAMTRSIPGPSNAQNNMENYKTIPPRKYPCEDRSYTSGNWDLIRKDLSGTQSNKQPNILYEEVQSKTRMLRSEKGVPSQKCDVGNDQSQAYHRVVKDKRLYEQTSGCSSDAVVEQIKESAINDEELLRAVLKKSMQSEASSSNKTNLREMQQKHEGHSEVCELGLKYLSNEIDLDQFIARIPLERIEEDVKRLMYKHYLGTNPNAKESDSTYERLMKKKMVVSFVDKDSESTHLKQSEPRNSCCVHCKKNICDQSSTHGSKSDNEVIMKQSDGSGRDKAYCYSCHKYSFIDSHDGQSRSDEEPDKLEKCVSPLDKSVATAVQTVDSFLDSERLPEEMTINCQFVGTNQCLCRCKDEKNDFSYSKFCTCKNFVQEPIPDPQKNIIHPNNQSSLNKSFYSPRPVKSCIKNNLEQKTKGKSDQESYQVTSKKLPSKEEVRHKDIKKDTYKVQISKKAKAEINIANQMTHSKEPLEVKVVDNRGNILSRGTRNQSDKIEKKTSKFNISKKGPNLGNKYSQIFEVIPEERNSPDYIDEYEPKHTDSRKKIKQNTPSFGLPKQHSIKSHSCLTDQSAMQYYGTPKKLVNKSVETISQKSVSTMVNFEQSTRDDGRRGGGKEKVIKNYQVKSKHSTGKSGRDIYADDMKRSIDEKKGVVIGRFHPVQDKSEIEEQSVRKNKQGRASNKGDSEDMMSLSKGWINFYLVRDSNDLTNRGDKDDIRTYSGEIEEESFHPYLKRSVPKSTQTAEKQVQLPTLSVKETRKGYKSSSECSNISLPEIRSSSSSGPSSPENRQRIQFFRQPVDTLPDLGAEGCIKKKKKHRYYSSGDQISDGGMSREEKRRTRRVEVSRSEHSVSSVTSSTIVLSESPGTEERNKDEDHKHKKSKAPAIVTTQSDSGSCWTVTVAGSGGTGNQAPPDVEMRLSFAGQRDDVSPQPQTAYSSHKPSNLAIKSSKHQEIAEEKPSSARSDTSLQYSSGDPVSSISMSKRMGHGRNQHSRMYLDHDDYRQLKNRKGASDDDWVSDGRGGLLHVTGSAITPEEKPRVPTQSERDLVRAHKYRFTR